jgi:hypothetical protein
MSTENPELIRRGCEAFGRGDIATGTFRGAAANATL